jgi:hypothetical protein
MHIYIHTHTKIGTESYDKTQEMPDKTQAYIYVYIST